jgi:hypothetical protein
LRKGKGRSSVVRPASSWMSYTTKPSDASTQERCTNLSAISRTFSSVVPSNGGVLPKRKTGLAGSIRFSTSSEE